MRVGRVLSVVVVSIASLIVIVAAVAAISVFGFSHSAAQQNFAPPEGQNAVSPVGDIALFSQNSGGSSFLYRKDLSNGKQMRLTAAVDGIESEPSFSHSGKLVVYSFAKSPESKSSVFIIGADGSNAHAITGEDEDALHPVFSPDDSKVFYGASRFTGNHSPIARPARHDWDVFSIPVQASGKVAGASPNQITHTSFDDLQSLDTVANRITPHGISVLISTTGYPIGALFREFKIEGFVTESIFQPHVPGEPSTGSSFGEARYIHGGMDILFLAASNASGGNYDYNVYSMSDVTGADLKQLTRLRGMTNELRLLPDGKATFINSGVAYVLDVDTKTMKPL